MNAAAVTNDADGGIEQTFASHQSTALRLRTSDANARIAKLKRLHDNLLAYQKEIYQAAHADFSKPEAEVDLTEIFPVIAEIKHTIAHLKRWMKPRRVRTNLAMIGTRSEIRYEPKGTSLIIVPWNYPINLAFSPLVSAIAAGCTAIVKPSELTPHLSLVTRKIIEASCERDEVAVFEGDVQVSSALLELPFDHIFFTGSPAVGKIVMAAASKHLTSVTLELGGKSPTIVDKSANITKAVRNILWAKNTNNGQTCIAPDYILVDAAVKEQFIEAAARQIEKTYGKNVQQSPDYCRIVNARHYGRVSDMLDKATEQGAHISAGGERDAQDRFIAPTLLTDVAADSDVMQDEIFGPLLPIVSYQDISEAIALINSKPKPLAIYIYSHDKPLTERVLRETSAGDSCINHSVIHFMNAYLPFGGVNNSGIGKSHGHWGFMAFSHERSVMREQFSVVHLMYPPYTKTVKTLIKAALKFFT